MANMNWVDYAILGVFFLSTLAGFGRGFVKEMISLSTLIAAFFVASKFSNSLAASFASSSTVQNAMGGMGDTMGQVASQSVPYVALGVSFLVLFVGTIIFGSLIGFFINMAFQAGILGIGNRLLGAIFGLARGFIINLVLVFIVQLTPASEHASWQQSQMVHTLQPSVQWLNGIVSPGLAHLKATVGQQLQGVGSQVQDVSNIYQGFQK
ncbi:MAG: CvpA family protein [Gammaproteobacteria bacterium]|nr:MAG: CvpA family protein [Gammaproteobacteria bacterium]